MSTEPTVENHLRACRSSAVHLEMRDAYTLDDPMLDAWRLGYREDPSNPSLEFKPWLELIKELHYAGS